ncbi:hypothetical protein CH259_00430 [Rhodococcus sp. 05-2254-4]|nr:hypothetical protein CH259_00430 [Rhodococcus sp. 05-2254-4]OZE47390.1 hypothetical protein CH261_10190 [Rhodococcus sp. 05-2254-3]OZE47689.1 hypothetical protein CH283_18305 [Rhodococcus sp. 05-2254-2]
MQDSIINAIALDNDEDPDELRAELEAAGLDLPIDSLLAVEVLATIEKLYGVSLKLNGETAKAMKSVTAFATLVLAAVELQADRQSA